MCKVKLLFFVFMGLLLIIVIVIFAIKINSSLWLSAHPDGINANLSLSRSYRPDMHKTRCLVPLVSRIMLTLA